MSSPGKSKASKRPAPKTSGDLLFEIGCEEIPAGMIAKASLELKAILQKYLVSHGLVAEPEAGSSFDTFGAPRRLVAIVREIRLRQEDVAREVTGPPKSVAFDNVGEPTRAAMSFAEKQGIPVSKLSIVNTPKGEYVAAKQIVIGKPAAEILATILPQAIQEISWPRSMYWTRSDSPRFIRPIRWIVAVDAADLRRDENAPPPAVEVGYAMIRRCPSFRPVGCDVHAQVANTIAFFDTRDFDEFWNRVSPERR